MKKFLYTLILFTLIVGCSCKGQEEPNNFYDIKGLNSEIKKKLDFDLLEIMKKTESVYAHDSTFYYKLIETFYSSDSVNYFKKAGIPIDPINSRVVHLNNLKTRDSLAEIMMLSYAQNIKLNDCNSKSIDSLCIYKLGWKSMMENTNPYETQMWFGYFHKSFKSLIDKKYLTENELNYMILYLHYLGRLISAE